jgi:antitoxin MazE
MEAEMRISKWGNSLAVRLPASLVESLNLKEGDEIVMRPSSSGDLDVYRKPTREELLERLKAFEGRFPADFKFDREEANAR